MKSSGNRRRGFNAERWRLRKLREQGAYGLRSYGSKGVVDIVYIDKDGIGHMEQIKYSSVGNARISKGELERLQEFADRWRGSQCHVSLVLKNAYEEYQVIRLNGLEPQTANKKKPDIEAKASDLAHVPKL